MANTTSWLNLWTWFSYINQNLDNVHNSADEIVNINDRKLETYLWEKIPVNNFSKKEIEDYVGWLSSKQKRWVLNNWTWFSTDWIVAYINNWDSWKNPFASWTWMFEKKWTVINPDWTVSEDWRINKLLKTLGYAAWWDVSFWLMEKAWKAIYNSATPQAKDDMLKVITNKNKEPLIDSINKRIAYYSNKIKDLKSKWWSEEEIAKLEKAYNQLVKQKKARTTTPDKTIRDFVSEEWYTSDDIGIAKESQLDKDTLWITDIEEKMAMSDAEFSRADILKSLTREDFWVSESVWEKEYKPIIDAEIEFYTDKWNVNMLELHDWKNEIDKEFEYSDLWERIQSAKNNIKSRTQDKISDKIKAQLDLEYPWQWMSEKVTKYWMYKATQDEFLKRWTKQATKPTKIPTSFKELLSEITKSKQWAKRKIWKIMEYVWKIRPTGIKNYLLKNKKLMALIWLWAVVLKNPVAQAGLTALEVAWDADMANEAWNFVEEYRKFAPIVQRISARLSSEPDTRIWWEFAWMTEEEKEKKYPLEEVKKDLEWLSDNWYEDFFDTYFWWNFWLFTDNGLDDAWDYFWWRLKNTWEKDTFQNFVENRGKIPEKTPWEELKANMRKLEEEKANRMKSK